MSITQDILNSDTLVIAFTGYANKLHLPIDAFFDKSGLSSASKIIISDPSKRKTLGGLPPDLPTFFDVLNYLRNEINRLNPKRIITTGTSGGGHPALLYGHLLKADQAIAFSPYPYLSKQILREMQDPCLETMGKVVELFDQLPDAEKNYFDLKDVLANWNGKTCYTIHVGAEHEWDLKRSKYMEGIKNLTIVEHPFNAHSIASALARHGKLSICFTTH